MALFKKSRRKGRLRPFEYGSQKRLWYNSKGNCGKVLVELGLNEQVPKVEKESNCDYFKLSIFSKKQSLKEQIITQVQT